MVLPKSFQAKILKNTQLTPRVHQIVLELLEPKTLEFTAGQFLMYQIPDNRQQTTVNREQTTENGKQRTDNREQGINTTIKRAYSIASLPSKALTKEGTPGKLELLVDISPGGPASKYFSDAAEGSSCVFMAPYGQFTLRNTPNDKVFLAGSTGVAPTRSMILDYLFRCQVSGVRCQNMSLYFGVNKTEEIFLLEEFSSLEFERPNFHFIPVVQNPEHGDWAGEKGLVTEPLFRNAVDLKNKDFYICGSPNMVHAVRQSLLDKGVPEANVFNERF